MSILVRFAPPSMTTKQYEQVKDALERSGDFPAEGMELHCCFGPEGNLRVSEIWSSRGQWERFTQRLMPEIERAGIDMSSGPEVLEVHNVVQPVHAAH